MGECVGSLGRMGISGAISSGSGALLFREGTRQGGKRGEGERLGPLLFCSQNFSPSLLPRSASLGAVSRDCLSHPFSFPP